jgi:uncharacterized protein (DUF952 family)
MGQIVYKIVAVAALAKAEEEGVLEASAADRRDGFVHFSTSAQLPGTLERHFTGTHHLMLLAFDAEALGEELRWEPSRGGELFPHLYRAPPIAALLWAEPLPTAADGSHPLSPKLLDKIGAAQ